MTARVMERETVKLYILTLSSTLKGKILSCGPPIRFILTRTWFLSTDTPSIIKSLGKKETKPKKLQKSEPL